MSDENILVFIVKMQCTWSFAVAVKGREKDEVKEKVKSKKGDCGLFVAVARQIQNNTRVVRSSVEMNGECDKNGRRRGEKVEKEAKKIREKEGI